LIVLGGKIVGTIAIKIILNDPVCFEVWSIGENLGGDGKGYLLSYFAGITINFEGNKWYINTIIAFWFDENRWSLSNDLL
jgi:hypothetical protein